MSHKDSTLLAPHHPCNCGCLSMSKCIKMKCSGDISFYHTTSILYHISDCSHMDMWFFILCSSYLIIWHEMQIYLSAAWVILSISETKIHNLSAVWNPQYLLKICLLCRLYTPGPFKATAQATQKWQQASLYLLGDLDHHQWSADWPRS